MTVTYAIENDNLPVDTIEAFASEPLSPEDSNILDRIEDMQDAVLNRLTHYKADSSDVQDYLDEIIDGIKASNDQIGAFTPEDDGDSEDDSDDDSGQFSGWLTKKDSVTLDTDDTTNNSLSPEDTQTLYSVQNYHKGILYGLSHYKADSSDIQSFLDDTIADAKECIDKIDTMTSSTSSQSSTQYSNFASSGDVPEYKWEGPIAFEGVSTGDNRFFKPNSIEWDEDSFPVPFRWQKSSVPGHTGAVPIGRVDRLERRDDGAIYGFGVVIPSLNEEAAEYLRLLESGVASGVSVDGDSAVFDVSEMANGQSRVVFSNMRVRSITAVDIPAFSDAQVDLVAAGVELDGEELRWAYNITAAACAPVKPPIDWFEDPKLEGPSAITVTSQGEIFGHLALFDSCHIGFPGSCVSPPKNGTYKYFHTGELETDKGDLVEVGHLTFNTGHAGMRDNAKVAAAHYDNTGTVAADVRVGEDSHGIWVAGALRSHLDDESVRAFRAAPLSGDWRRIAGKLELVGALAVNVPGFPVPRLRTLVASGETETLLIFQESDDAILVDKKAELAQRVFPSKVEEVEAVVPLEDSIEQMATASYTIKKQFGKFCVADDKGMIVKGGCYKTNDEATAKIKSMSSPVTADSDYQEMATASYSIKKQFGKFCVADEKGMIVKGGCFKTNDEAAAKIKSMSSPVTTTASVSEGIKLATGGVDTKKKEGAQQFPASDYAYVPDSTKPSTWKLRLTNSPGADPDAGTVGAAVAALGEGFRGNKVDIPDDDRSKVIAKVKAAWFKANSEKTKEDLPPVLKGE